jgi:hypothetical protein
LKTAEEIIPPHRQSRSHKLVTTGNNLETVLDRRFILQRHTTEMEVEQMTEPMTESMAKIDAYEAKMLAAITAGLGKTEACQ